jgi:hypothetical protein
MYGLSKRRYLSTFSFENQVQYNKINFVLISSITVLFILCLEEVMHLIIVRISARVLKPDMDL